MYIRCLARSSEVDDLVQETLVTAWKHLDRFDRSKPFGPWLRGIARNLVMAHHRQSAGAVAYDPAWLLILEDRCHQLHHQPGDTLEEKLECLRLCIDYAKTRTLWGKEIGQFQLIQLKLASMEVARMNVRNMLFRVIESGQAGRQIPLAEASAMKWYCSQAATDVAMDAIQLFGGNGYMTEYRVEQLARDAKSLMIYAGSNEVQITHVAKGLLA